jgi:putative ABC transport system permease protein
VQSLSSSATIAVSIGTLFALFLLCYGVSLGLETGKKRLGADLLVIPADAWSEPEEVLFTGAPMNMYMDARLEDTVRAIPGVERVDAQFFTQTLNEDCCSLSSATRLIGFNTDSDAMILALLKDFQQKHLSSNEVIIGSKVGGYPGNSAIIMNKTFRVAAVLDPTGTSVDYSILMPIESARTLAIEGKSGYLAIYWEKYGHPDKLISAMLVEVTEGYSKEEVAGIISGIGKIKVVQTGNILSNLKGQMKALFLIGLISGLMTAFLSILNLFSRFFAMVWDRKGEWGLYRALGATRSDLKKMVVGEALLLFMGAAIPGTILGYFLYYWIFSILKTRKAFPFIEPSWPIVCLGLLAILTLFALLAVASAWLPASRSGRIEPSAAMALEDID